MPSLVPVHRMLEAVRESDDSLALLRQRRAEAFTEYAGRFAWNITGPQRPLNLMHRGVTVLLAHLAARSPRHEVTPISDLSLRFEALKLGMKLDQMGEQLDRQKISRLCLIDALLGPKAIVKVGLRAGDEMFKINGRLYDPGEPYIQRIDLDDWVCDPTARCRDELLWEGHRYRVPRQQAIESGLFNPDVIEALPTVSEMRSRTNKPSEGLGRQASLRVDADVADQIELLDIVFYGSGGPTNIVTMPGNPAWADDYLRDVEYQGPSRGPFHWLEFYPLPNQLHGVPWASVVREQSELASQLMLKWANEVKRSKKLGLVQDQVSEDEAKRVMDAPDSAWVRVQDPTKYGMVDLSAQVNELPAAIRDVMGWWNIQSGSTDRLGGTGSTSGSKTATEFSGLQAAASTVLEDMRMQHEEFEAGISRDLAFFVATDPVRQSVLHHRLPGGEFIPLVYDPMTRENDHLNYGFKIRPRSMQGQDPNARAARIIETVQTVIMSVEAAMATGGAIDPMALARKLGDIQDIDALEDIVKDPQAIIEKQMLMASMPQQGMGMPAGGGMGGAPGQPQMSGQMPGMPQMGMGGGMGTAGPPQTKRPAGGKKTAKPTGANAIKSAKKPVGAGA